MVHVQSSLFQASSDDLWGTLAREFELTHQKYVKTKICQSSSPFQCSSPVVQSSVCTFPIQLVSKSVQIIINVIMHKF